jgi:membrane protein implicated in regulation of membrane protease activity
MGPYNGGENAIVMDSDAASRADIDTLADRVKAEFGTLDVLFVNAGLTHFVPFESMTEAMYDELLTVNAKGPYFTVQKLAPLMTAGSAVVLTTAINAADQTLLELRERNPMKRLGHPGRSPGRLPSSRSTRRTRPEPNSPSTGAHPSSNGYRRAGGDQQSLAVVARWGYCRVGGLGGRCVRTPRTAPLPLPGEAMGSWIVWLVLAAVLGVAEVMTTTLAFGLIAVGAVVAAVAGAAGVGLPFQLAAFAVASAAGLVVVRPIAMRHIKQPPLLRTGTSALVGRSAKVVAEVTDDGGQVRIGGELWSARPYDESQVIPVGSTVDVFAIEGATALVHPRE